jgi:hypothetical protein
MKQSKQEKQEEQVRLEEYEIEKQQIENKRKQKILIRISIVIGAILSLTVLILLFVYVKRNESNQYYNTGFEMETNTDKTDDIETLLTRLVFKWNDAHSLNSVDMFADLYHWEIFFYGTNLNKDVVCGKKLSLLKKYDDFEQEIYSGIRVNYIHDNEYRCDFVKRATANRKTNDYPSYLVFRKVNNDWKIVTESDKITDKNLKSKKSSVNNYYDEADRLCEENKDLTVDELWDKCFGKDDKEAQESRKKGASIGCDCSLMGGSWSYDWFDIDDESTWVYAPDSIYKILFSEDANAVNRFIQVYKRNQKGGR